MNFKTERNQPHMKFQNATTFIEQKDLISALHGNLLNDYNRNYSENELKMILDSFQSTIESYLALPENTKNDDVPVDSIIIQPFGHGSSLTIKSYLDNGSVHVLNGATIVTQPRTRVKARYSSYFQRRIINGLKN